MHLIKLTLSVVSLSLAATTAFASIESPANNVEFQTISRVEPALPGAKVDVIEFFSYSCPFCNSFDPYLSGWVKSRGDSIAFRRVPLIIHSGDEFLQKTFYALEIMGKGSELHDKLFHAIHVEHKHLDEEAAIADFVAAQGVDRTKFLDAFNSFGVQTKVQRAVQLAGLYKVTTAPFLVTDGRFETSPGITQSGLGSRPPTEYMIDTLKITDWLVLKSLAEHKAQGAVVKK